MVDGKPADYVPVIKANWKNNHAYLLASSGNCIDGWKTFATRGRNFIKPLGALPSVAPPSKTVIGIVVCPGDDLAPVMAWIAKHRIAPAERVLIVYHPSCDMVEILRPWYKMFDVSPLVLEVTKWPGDRVNKRFGEWYNDWIYLDATGQSWPL